MPRLPAPRGQSNPPSGVIAIALFHRRKVVGIRPDINSITGGPDPVEILSARILLAEHLVGGMALPQRVTRRPLISARQIPGVDIQIFRYRNGSRRNARRIRQVAGSGGRIRWWPFNDTANAGSPQMPASIARCDGAGIG